MDPQGTFKKQSIILECAKLSATLRRRLRRSSTCLWEQRSPFLPRLTARHADGSTPSLCLNTLTSSSGHCLSCLPCHHVPSGSKLIRSEKKGDGSWLCIFGVYRSFDQFVLEAQGLLHPFDTLAQLPDYLIKALFEQLTLSPMQLSKIRLERIQKWRDRAKQLSSQEEKLRAGMSKFRHGLAASSWPSHLRNC